jgi:S-sulfo-L-cysteine synthase (3-phospho-L-serine-dependent)
MAVQRLLAGGHRVTFLTRTRQKYPFLAPAHPGLQVGELDTNSLPIVLDAIRAIQAREGVDVILTFSEFYVCCVAEVAARLGFRGPEPRSTRTCRHKPATRQALRAAGLLTPDFCLLTSEEKAQELALRISYPCVVKPPSDSSSHGVRLVRNPTELLEHYRLLHGWRENVRGQSLDGSVLVESLLQGPEYSVETFTLADGDTRVIGVTDKHLSPAPYFVEVGHDFPSRADEVTKRSLIDTVIRALAAVGFNFGPAHTEVRWTERGPVVVEINPRLAGGMIPELVSYATGVDLLQIWTDLLLGHSIDLAAKRDEVASIRFLTADRAGRVREVNGVQEALSIPSVREVSMKCQRGAMVNLAEDAYDRLGFVIASGHDPSVVSRDLAEALTRIQIEVEPVACEVTV